MSVDSARRSQIEAKRSDRRVPAPSGQGEKAAETREGPVDLRSAEQVKRLWREPARRDRFGKVAASQNSQNLSARGIHWFILRFISVCCFIGLLSGCGYRWESDEGRPTVSIPYVAGDADGSLTGEILRQIAVSGVCEVRQWDAKYRLQAAIVGSEGQTVGYRRDRQRVSGENQKNLVAAERRKTLVVEAALYESESDRIACGPFRVEAYVDFDYVDGDSIQDLVFIDPSGVSQTVLPFSLGQLESSEAAEEAAMRPLNDQIARKIVDALFAGR